MGNTDIERLITRLEANHRDYARDMMRAQVAADRQLKKIDARLSKTSRRFSSFSKGAAGALAGILTAAAARRLVGSIESALDKLDGIAKSADKIGLTTDALQELRVAAELSGVSVKTFEMAFQRFTRRTAEAAKGTGEAKGALKELGVELTTAEGRLRPVEDLFKDVADAISKVEDPADRVRLSMKLFDSEGVALVNMLTDGAAGLDRMRAKARELGIVIDESLIRRSVKAKDELSLMKDIIGTKMTVALAELAPHLVNLAGLLTDIVTAASRAADGMREFAKGVAEGMLVSKAERLIAEKKAEIAAVIRAGEDALNEQANKAGPTPPSASSIPKLGPDATRALEIRNLKLERLNAELADLVDDRQRLENLIAEMNNPGGASGGVDGDAGGDGGGGFATGSGTSTKSETTFSDLLGNLDREANALELQIRLLGKTTREAAKLRAETQLLTEARARGIAIGPEERKQIEIFAGDIGMLTEMEEKLRAEVDAAAEAIRDQELAAEETGRALGDMFNDAILRAEDLDQALIGLAKSLASLAIQGLFGQGPASGLGGILGGLGSSILNGIFGGGGGSPFTGIRPGREHGGPVTAGRPYIVGEKRPELFVPNTSGVILPRVPQGGGPVINVSISNSFALGVRAEVRAEIDAATPRIVNAAKAGVAEAAKRGGGYTKAFRG